MDLSNPWDLGILLTGILAATGVAWILAIFGLYSIEDRLNRRDEQPAPEDAHDGPACMVTYPDRCRRAATTDTHGWVTCDQHAPRSAA